MAGPYDPHGPEAWWRDRGKTGPALEYQSTAFGSFALPECHEPSVKYKTSIVYYFCFTVLAGIIKISLLTVNGREAWLEGTRAQQLIPKRLSFTACYTWCMPSPKVLYPCTIVEIHFKPYGRDQPLP